MRVRTGGFFSIQRSDFVQAVLSTSSSARKSSRDFLTLAWDLIELC